MNILTICDQGNNRSVQFAHLLKYKYSGSDVIPAGLNLSHQTLKMLCNWADIIILTDKLQKIPDEYIGKIKVWDVGEDHYPRPFNSELNRLARKIIEENPL